MRVDDFINVAASFVGIRENPPGSNDTPIGAEFGWNGVSWCAEFVSVVCHRLGFPLHEAAVIRIEQHARNGDWGMHWTRAPVRGAAVCFDWRGHGNPNDMHVGIVTDVGAGGRFSTIEGNYSDSVQRVQRDMTYVRGFAMFPFDGQVAPGPAEPTSYPTVQQGSIGTYVQRVQQIIKDHCGGNIAVDGQFGPQTKARVEDVQRQFHLVVDGVVGPVTWGVLNNLAKEPF